MTYIIFPCKLLGISLKSQNMAKELTAREVDTAQLPEGKSEHELYDGDNLILRLRKGTKKTSKSWLIRYSTPNGRKKMTIGTYPALTLAEAREQSFQKLKMLEQGIDPLIEQANKEAEALAAAVATESGEIPLTIRDLFARWEKDYLQHHHTDRGEYVRNLFENHILNQQYADLRLDLVKKPHTIVALNNIRDKGVTRTCGIALTNLRQMYGFGIDHEWLQTDPTRGLTPKTWKGQSVEVERFLEEYELIDLYKRMYRNQFPLRWQAAIWLITAMGTRAEETMLTEIAHLNLEKRTWFIPKENQKKVNNTPLKDKTLYLSEFAASCLRYLVSIAGESKYLFPGRFNSQEDRPVEDSTLTKAVRDRQRDTQIKGRTKGSLVFVLQGGTWTPHDLRRTMSTQMQELGISTEIIDKCLAHAVDDKIRRTYQRAELRGLMSDAWHKWGDKLAALLVKADAELKLELIEEARIKDDEGAKKNAYTPRLRNARSGRGDAAPLLEILAPFAPKSHAEHVHG